MLLANGKTEIEIDDRTGQIVRIRNRRTGLMHLDATGERRGDARLFRIMTPGALWSSRNVDSNEADPPEVRREGGALLLRWPSLKARGEPTGVCSEVRVELPEGSDEVRFSLTVRNAGQGDAVDIWFPCLGGWTGVGGKGKDTMVLGAREAFDPHSFPINRGTTYARWHQRQSFGHPFALYAPWVDISGPGGGLSYIVYMTRAQNGQFAVENLAGHARGLRLAFGWDFTTVVRPGETWTSPPVGLALHDGDWHDTADRYNAWAATWFTPPPGKRALRESIGYQNVFLRGFDGAPFRPLDSVPSIAADGRKYGVNHLSIWDFVTLGNYSKQADLDVLDYTPEERQTLRRGLLQAKAEGTNVNALINFRLCSASSSLYRREGNRELVRCYDGSPRMACFSASHEGPAMWARGLGPQVYWLSAFARSHRERVLRQTREYCDLGYVSMFFDQPFEVLPDYGYMDEGKRPEDAFAAVGEQVAEVRHALHERDADSFMIGEFCSVFLSQSIDMWMSWYMDFPPAVRTAYAFPQTMHSWVVDTDAAQASRAFAMGMYLCLCTHGNEGTLADEPEFAEHVHALAKLRKKVAERTVYARFNDMRGLELRSGGGIVAYRYDSPSGPAVILAAPGCKGEATVRLDRQAFAAPAAQGPGRLHRLDGTTEVVQGEVLQTTLKENEVAVWLA